MPGLVSIRDGRALGVGTRLALTVPDGLVAASAAMDTVLGAVDAAYSRFRPDSELSRLNAAAGRLWEISPLFARALAAGLGAAQLTDGAVDPTVGHAIRIVGYDTTFADLESTGPALRLKAEPVPGWRLIELDPASRRVRIPPGLEIDLGATGKGLAADLCAAAAFDAVGRRGGVLVSLGGDIAVAGDPPPGGWIVQLAEDSGAAADAATERVSLSSGALATSSKTVRRWVRGDIPLHHILDPTTGLPADGPWRTVSVAAASCVDANAAATGAIVKGDSAPGWLASLGLPARLVATDGSLLLVGGWPAAHS
jgi:thiamine biosynthesis lipoprotein ApbE